MRIQIILIAIIIISCSKISGQETILYNSKGQLKFNTNYIVDSNKLEYIKDIECILYDVYKRFSYPGLAVENGISGNTIVKVVIEKKSMSCSFKLMWLIDALIDTTLLNTLNESKSDFLKSVKYQDSFVFYIPFMFEVESRKFTEDLKVNKAIRIKREFLKPELTLVNSMDGD